MVLHLEENQLQHMLNTAAEFGAKTALTEAGLQKKEITKAEAYRRYSRRNVDGWILSGKIKPVARGVKTMLVIVELEILAKTNQLYQKHLSKVN